MTRSLPSAHARPDTSSVGAGRHDIVTVAAEYGDVDVGRDLRVCVLGSLEAQVAGRSGAPLAPQSRRLLAMLCVAPGVAVPRERIAEDVTHGDGSTVRMAVARLRRAVGDCVVTDASGYRLDAAGLVLDSVEFERLLDEARSTDHAARRREVLRGALALWRGAAFDGFADEPWCMGAAVRLEELRSVATEELAEACLAVGRPGDAVEILEAELLRSPFRERPVALMMRSLAGAGRMTEALRAFQRFRVALRDEAGLEPSASLRDLEAALLRADGDRSDGTSDRAVSIGGTPHPATARLVGRADAVASICELLPRARLVTLVGPGGVGKTALAVACAERARPDHSGGTSFCDLSTTSDPDEVAMVVASGIGITTRGDVLGDVVRGTPPGALVLLDNCEHLVDTAAEVAEALTRRRPDVSVLVTSREPLGVGGEHVVEVEPLEPADAVELFMSLRSAAGEAAPGGADAALVGEVCRQLDGLPLAIELAAARSRSLPLADLRARLGERLALLASPRREARHRSLTAAFQWSWDLLRDEERQLLGQLAVFSGTFTVEALRAVCDVPGVAPGRLGDVAGALADKSMIAAVGAGRFRVLETVRQFGEERLRETGDLDVRRDAHATWYAAFAVECHDGLQGEDQGAWYERLVAEWANVRAAFRHCVASGDAERAALIATRMMWPAMWHDTGEAFAWVRTVGGMDGVDATSLHADVLGTLAWEAWEAGRNDESYELGLASVAAERDGQPNMDFFAEFALLSAAFFRPDLALAAHHLDLALERCRAHERAVHEAVFATSRVVMLTSIDLERALAQSQRAVELAHASRNPGVLAWALAREGIVLADLGAAGAREVLDRSLELAERTGSRFAADSARGALAHELVGRGRAAEAIPMLLARITAMRRRSMPMFMWQQLAGLAGVLTALDRLDAAATVYGAVHRSLPAGLGMYRAMLDEPRRHLEAQLDAPVLELLVASGEALRADEALTVAETALRSFVAER